MSRYIDADKINPSDVFGGMNEFAQDCRNAVIELLNIQPTADVSPVKHGKWIDGKCMYCGTEAKVSNIGFSCTGIPRVNYGLTNY